MAKSITFHGRIVLCDYSALRRRALWEVGIFLFIIARVPRLGILIANPLLVWTIPIVLLAAQSGSYVGSRRLTQTNVRRVIGAVLISVGTYITLTSF